MLWLIGNSLEQEGKALSQYERIVSYLYRYEHGEKRENSGYAKVERREKECRISLQVKISVPVHEAKAYFYIQKPSGIRTIEIGEVMVGRNEMRLKQRTEIDNLFGSGESFENIDGIFIYSGVTVCYATTWKNDYFYQGDWRQEEAGAKPILKKENAAEEERPETTEEKESKEDVLKEKSREEAVSAESREEVMSAESREKVMPAESREEVMPVESREEVMPAESREEVMPAESREEVVLAEHRGEVVSAGNEVEEAVTRESNTEEPAQAESVTEEHEENVEREMVQETGKSTEQELKMQSVCEECPLKKESVSRSYGDRILRTLPTMYPFKDVERGCCVKMELQDIGCLPMRFWSLSGNRFLLHGYYCYRHLIFLREDGSYLLGVPGIYNEKEFKNSVKYGFSSFRQIGEEKRQGAFGYWLMKL